MALKPNRTTEAEAGVAVMQILAAQPSGQATVATLKKELPRLIKLSVHDQEGSLTRSNEELWEQ
jgi:hypothetical protein